MVDEVSRAETVLRERLGSGLDPYFAGVTLDLLGHLGNAIFECRMRGVLGWNQPVLMQVIRLDWIWRLATEQVIVPPDPASAPVAVADFRDDVIGALRWYLRNLREDGVDLSQPLAAQPDLADLELRHSLFTLPIAQAAMRSQQGGTAMLDRLRTVLGDNGRPSIH